MHPLREDNHTYQKTHPGAAMEMAEDEAEAAEEEEEVEVEDPQVMAVAVMEMGQDDQDTRMVEDEDDVTGVKAPHHHEKPQ
jgi:hypothetical protein